MTNAMDVCIPVDSEFLQVDTSMHGATFIYYRTRRITDINDTNKINRINNRLIDLCKLGSGLFGINKKS